jgi:hypothetical protein
MGVTPIAWSYLTPDLNLIKTLLAHGRAVAFSFLLYDKWYNDEVAKRMGNMYLLPEGEKQVGALCVVFVGNNDNTATLTFNLLLDSDLAAKLRGVMKLTERTPKEMKDVQVPMEASTTRARSALAVAD